MKFKAVVETELEIEENLDNIPAWQLAILRMQRCLPCSLLERSTVTVTDENGKEWTWVGDKRK